MIDSEQNPSLESAVQVKRFEMKCYFFLSLKILVPRIPVNCRLASLWRAQGTCTLIFFNARIASVARQLPHSDQNSPEA